MDKTELESLLVSPEETLRDAMQRLQNTGKGVVLLIDGHGIFRRTLTDGDVRRLLLADFDLSQHVHSVPDRQSVTAPGGIAVSDAIEIMQVARVAQLPLLDGLGRPVDLLFLADIDAHILLSTPHLGEDEMAYVEEAFRTNWIAPLGPNVDAFEKAIASQTGVAAAAAMSSGTAAIHVALRLLDVGPGDEVFCSSLTFVASANPILYQYATPVFIDCDPDTWNISVPALARAFETKAASGKLPKALVVVNLYGQSADMDPIVELCDRYGVPMVEDAAESLGASYRGRPSGSFGRIGIFSFNGNKIITTSGGGMLVSDDPKLVERARFLSTQAREPAGHYQHSELGYNYRMSNVLAGIGRGQLSVLEDRVAARRAIFARYQNALSDLSSIEWMPEADYGISNRWLTACTIHHRSKTPDAIIAALAEKKIEARRVWKPMHMQPLFDGAEFFSETHGMDNAQDLFERGLCLPSGSNMTEADVDRVSVQLRRILTDA